jgi:hypothetical protein
MMHLRKPTQILAYLFCICLFVSGCDNQPKDEKVNMERPHQKSELANDMSTLELPLRLAFMSGHVQAGLALYKLGEMEMAAPHLLHPISEMHKSERVGLQKLGLDVVSFVAVSAALEARRASFEIEPLLSQADSNLQMLADRAGGASVTIIMFLLELIIQEYSIAVTDGRIADIGEYQDAYGFHLVAMMHAKKLPEEIRSKVTKSLSDLGSLWMDGPKPVKNPTSKDLMIASVNSIMDLLDQ